MTNTIIPPAVQTFVDINGAPLAGGTVTFLISGTDTPKDTYQDAAGTTLNTNPIVLDERGQAIVWGSGVYRQILRDADANTIWDSDTGDAVVVTPTAQEDREAIGIFDNYEDATNATGLSDTITSIVTLGYYTAGDGGGGTYVEVVSQPNHDGWIHAGSRWFELETGLAQATPEQFGAYGDDTANDAAAINSAIQYLTAQFNGGIVLFSGKSYKTTAVILMEAGIKLRGAGRGDNTTGYVSRIHCTAAISAAIENADPSALITDNEISGILVDAPSTTYAVVDAQSWGKFRIRDNWIYGNTGATTAGIIVRTYGSFATDPTYGVISENEIGGCSYPVFLQDNANSTVVEKNRLQPLASGNGVRIYSASGSFPNNITVSANAIETTLASVIGVNVLGNADGVYISSNRFELSGATTTGVSVSTTASDVILSGNYYSGVTNKISDSGNIARGVDDALKGMGVEFDGATAAIATGSSFNVASVVRNSTGKYTITFSQALAASRFKPSVAVLGSGCGVVATYTNSAIDIWTLDFAGAVADFDQVYVTLSMP